MGDASDQKSGVRVAKLRLKCDQSMTSAKGRDSIGPNKKKENRS